MISAFGIDHTVSKAYVKLRPKLGAGLEDEAVKAHGTMNEKLRRHALQARMTAGGQGQSIIRRLPSEAGRKEMLSQPYQGKRLKADTRHGALRQMKQGAQGIYDTLGRQGRKKRVLP